MRNKPIRDTLIRAAGAGGLHCVRRIKRQLLVDLINRLKPVNTGKPLVRIGPDTDGGYLVPNDLEDIRYAFSPGVSTESGFEAELAARGMRVFLADYSVEAPAEQNKNFEFQKKFITSVNDDTQMTMDAWKQQSIGDYDGDLLLQMDIESGEFEAIFSASDELLKQFRIMVIEVHYLHQLWNKPWFILIERVFNKLLANHSVVHIHPNNCCGSLKSAGLELPRVLEFTFYRNDRFERGPLCTTFPHPLDRDNTAKKHLVLPHCWYG